MLFGSGWQRPEAEPSQYFSGQFISGSPCSISLGLISMCSPKEVNPGPKEMSLHADKPQAILTSSLFSLVSQSHFGSQWPVLSHFLCQGMECLPLVLFLQFRETDAALRTKEIGNRERK